jgi:hypothetical protein
MIITGNFSNWYGANMLPAVNRKIDDRYKDYPPFYREVMEVDKSSRSVEQISYNTGIGLFRPVAEGAAVTYDKPLQGLTRTFTFSDFALAFLVTHQMIRDDKWKIINNAADALVRSSRESIEVQAATVFNGAFSTTLLPTGQALISANHPRLKAGGVRSNKLVAADLNMTSLQAAMTLFESQTDDAGIPKMIPYSFLHIPKTLRFKAARLLKSADDPETANRATNVLKYGMDGMPGMKVNRRLTAVDSWFLQGKPSDTGIIWWWRVMPYKDHWTDSPTRSAHHAMWYACGYGAYSDLGIVGCSAS